MLIAMAQEVETIINIEEEENHKYPYGQVHRRGSNRNRPISVEEFDLSNIDVINLDDDEDDVVILDVWKERTPVSRRRRKPKSIQNVFFSGLTIIEIGESSSCGIDPLAPPRPSTPTAFCAICMEPKLVTESFSMSGCSHMFCSDCTRQYIASKIQENATSICCPDPDCKNGCLEPEKCSSILPPEVFERWCSILCESSLIGSTGFYCPFKDCSAPLLNEPDVGCALELLRESECPYCWRMLCAQCKVPWHVGFTCEAFQMLGVDERGQEDIMLMNMAKDNKWQRCPKCKIFVERTEGCMFMKCRCGYTFCYGCGTEMTVDHYCQKCKR